MRPKPTTSTASRTEVTRTNSIPGARCGPVPGTTVRENPSLAAEIEAKVREKAAGAAAPLKVGATKAPANNAAEEL